MRRRLGHDDELIAELCGIFLADYLSQLADLERAIDRCDLPDAGAHAHRLKSSAANLSAAAVVSAAAALEDAAERGDAQSIPGQFATLALEIDGLVADLRVVVDRVDGPLR